MRNRRFAPLAFIVAAFLVMAGLVVGASAGFAQSATPSGEAAATGQEIRPAHIHSGACPAPGEVVFPLNDVVAPGMPATMMGTPVAMADASPEAGAAATPTAGLGKIAGQSVTVVKTTLSELTASLHSIVVHESVTNIQTYLVCGNIKGKVKDGTLTIGLNQLNASGYQGSAELKDNGDGTTTVTVTLAKR